MSGTSSPAVPGVTLEMRGCIADRFLGFEFGGIGVARPSCGTANASESLVDCSDVATKAASHAVCGNIGADRETNVTASHAKCDAMRSAMRLKELELNRVRRKWEGAVSLPSRTAWFREAAALR
jgi:hypothetical protein